MGAKKSTSKKTSTKKTGGAKPGSGTGGATQINRASSQQAATGKPSLNRTNRPSR